MVYVALLRGINVGGNNKVDMKQLKIVFENAGMLDVSTYINSGNVIFKDDIHPKEQLEEILESTIFEAIGITIKVLICDIKLIAEAVRILPESWANNDSMKCDAMFLWDSSIDSVLPAVLNSSVSPDLMTSSVSPDSKTSSDLSGLLDSSNLTNVPDSSEWEYWRKHLTIKEGIDSVIYSPGVILWAIERINVNRSGLFKIVGTALYKKITVRNVNTLRKIYEIMKLKE